jgi:predicted dinucleotide-binding enzyme
VTTFGREGGDAMAADVLVVAVPGAEIAGALGKMHGIEGKVAIDVTNSYGGRDERFESNAHHVKSITGGPVAKAFNTNFAALYRTVGDQRVRPSNLYAADDDARGMVEQLTRDAGYDPIPVGGLEHARDLENFNNNMIRAIITAGRGPFFYKIWAPGSP